MNWLTKSDFFLADRDDKDQGLANSRQERLQASAANTAQKFIGMMASKTSNIQPDEILERIVKKSQDGGSSGSPSPMSQEPLVRTLKEKVRVEEQKTSRRASEEDVDNEDQDDQDAAQNLTGIDARNIKAMFSTNLRGLQERKMQARIASSYFPDKKVYQQAKFDIKTALISGMQKDRELRKFHEKQKEKMSLVAFAKQDLMLIATNNYDIVNTQKQMKKNSYFQEYFEDYQKRLEQSLGDLDDEAGSNATSFTRYYTCKDKYGPKI